MSFCQKFSHWLILIVLFCCFSSKAETFTACDRELIYNETAEIDFDHIEHFYTYIQILIEENILTLDEAKNLLQELESDKDLTNPLTGLQIESARLAHQNNFQMHLNHIKPSDRKKLIELLATYLKSHHQIRRLKDDTRVITTIPIIKAQFYKLPKGRFLMGVAIKDVNDKYVMTKEKKLIVIEEDFELMHTPVTQWMWVQLKILMGDFAENPSTFKSDITYNHPVEMISWLDSKELIDKLNQLSLSKDEKVQEGIRQIIEDHQPGDLYDFPTIEQTYYVKSNLGTYGDRLYFDRNDYEDLNQFAWTEGNSEGTTHSVAERAPRVVNNSPFYDLHGNVRIWTKTPRFDVQDSMLVTYDSFQDEIKKGHLGSWAWHKKISRGNSIGLRLVRYRR